MKNYGLELCTGISFIFFLTYASTFEKKPAINVCKLTGNLLF